MRAVCTVPVFEDTEMDEAPPLEQDKHVIRCTTKHPPSVLAYPREERSSTSPNDWKKHLKSKRSMIKVFSKNRKQFARCRYLRSSLPISNSSAAWTFDSTCTKNNTRRRKLVQPLEKNAVVVWLVPEGVEV